ncbi:epoxide hydrolase [soil metagenome]
MEAIRTRLADAVWTYAPEDDADWRYGTDVAWLRSFVDHWTTVYDWTAAQRRLNGWPQFKAEIDGVDLHFYHVKGSASRPRPLVLTHGWPGSVIEFHGMIDRLAHPERFGGHADDGFDVVIPSLPGYAFSSRPATPIGPRHVARLWRELMTRLGYDRFGAQGGDWGSGVSSWLGSDHSDVVVGIHLNMVSSWTAPTTEPTSEAEREYRRNLATVQRLGFGYHGLLSTKPQTIGIALSDSPLGFAAWVTEKFREWGDTGGDIDSRFSRDDLITNLMLYLLNDAVNASGWLYRGRVQEAAGGGYADMKVDVPTGVALFPAEFIPYPPREVAERAYRITRWTPMSAGGHFAALEEPVALSNDIRTFFDFL